MLESQFFSSLTNTRAIFHRMHTIQPLSILLSLTTQQGYMWEYPVARAFADGRVSRIYGGSNEIMKELISRSI